MVERLQPSKSNNATTVADSLMELHVEMRSADTDMYMDETVGPVGVPPEVCFPIREL
jgi:hypothetical protein